MAGVMQVLTRKPGDASVKVDLEGASHGTARASLFAGGSHGPWRGTASGEAFTTDGYILVPEDQRGAVDMPATQRYDSGRVGMGYETAGFYARVDGRRLCRAPGQRHADSDEQHRHQTTASSTWAERSAAEAGT